MDVATKRKFVAIGPDLLGEIFSHLDKKSLACAARASRLFNDAAIRILWKELDSFSPLVKLFPSDSLTVSPKKSITLSRTLFGSDWDRFNLYARRVRILGNVPDPSTPRFFDVRMADSTLQRFRLAQNPTLLPAIQTLIWRLETSHDLSGLCQIISPSLRAFHFCIHNREMVKQLGGLLNVLETIRPSLAELGFWTSFSSNSQVTAELAGYLVQILRSQCRIIQISTDVPVFERLLPYCDLFSGIHTLDLRETKPWENPHAALPPPKDAFPELKGLGGGGILYWTYLLPHIGLSVCHIDLQCGRTGGTISTTMAAVAEFFEVVGASCPSLTVLKLADLDFKSPERTQFIGALYPLLRCVSLKTLSLKCVGCEDVPTDLCYSLSDHDILQMAKAWPNLEKLKIRDDDTYDGATLGTPPLTLQSVISLRQHCRRIRSVTLTLDVSIHPATISGAAASEPLPRLSKLDFSNSSISDPVALAVWLEDVCHASDVHWVQSQSTNSFARDQKWQFMKMFLSHLQTSPSVERELLRVERSRTAALAEENAVLRKTIEALKETIQTVAAGVSK